MDAQGRCKRAIDIDAEIPRIRIEVEVVELVAQQAETVERNEALTTIGIVTELLDLVLQVGRLHAPVFNTIQNINQRAGKTRHRSQLVLSGHTHHSIPKT
jgi:hypothetical protein